MEGEQFTIADIAVGAYARRWLGFKGIKQPKFPHLERWFAELASRPAFAKHLGGPMS
jgi:glutathione S-transferase